MASESIPGLSPGAVGALTYIDVRITTVHPSVAGDFAAFRVVEPVLNTFKSLVIFQRELNGAGQGGRGIWSMRVGRACAWAVRARGRGVHVGGACAAGALGVGNRAHA